MPCPWYRDGYCHSPALGEPSSDPVINAVCLGSEAVYKKCPFYRERAEVRREEGVRRRSGKYGRPLLLIHSLKKCPKSDCEFFVVEEDESGAYLAACNVLRRYLTRYEVPLCENHWKDCPYRRIGITIESSE